MNVAAQHLLPLLLVSACSYDDITIYRGCAGGLAPTPMSDGIRTADQVFGILEGRSMVMNAPDVPSHPNGYDANVNFGQATQCINQVEMSVLDRRFHVATKMANLEGAPRPEDVGTCDFASANGQEFAFDTTAALITNVSEDATCFDITFTYSGFGQEGRGSLSADRQTVTLELFFRDQATGHRCDDGPVGSPTVVLNQEPFRGTATQLYRIMQ